MFLISGYLQPIQFVLGILANMFSIWIFCSRPFRTSACAQYSLAYTIFNMMYASSASSAQFLRLFHIEWSNGPIRCYVLNFILLYPTVASRVMLVFATFDRCCSSSASLRLRSISTVKIARIVIITVTILVFIDLSPVFVIYYWNETNQICATYTDRISNTFFFIQVILYYILGPVLILLFGGLTVYNIRKYKVHVQNNRRTEGQLARMLLTQIAIHIILTVPFGVIYFMQALDPSTRTLNMLAIRYLLAIFYQCDFFIAFFLYVLTGKVYRRQFFKILTHRNRQVSPR